MLPALVLTAGLGTRLDPLTRLVAKAAVPLGRSTLIEHVLDWLRTRDVRDVVLNLHHRPESVAAVVGDGSQLGLRVRYSWEQPLLGSAGGPRRALPLLESSQFLIVNGDTLCDVPLGDLVARHRATGADVTMALIPNPDPAKYNGLEMADDGRLIGLVPKGGSTPTWHFVGTQVVDASIFQGLPEGVPAETVHGFYRNLMRESPERIRGFVAREPFLDIGTPEDYWRVAMMLQAERGAVRPGEMAEPWAGETRIQRSVIWPGVRLGRDNDLDRTVVAGPVQLPDGFRAKDAIVIPAHFARPADRARVEGPVAVFDLSL